MKKSILFLFLLLSSVTVFCQWQSMATNFTSNGVRSICFTSSTDGYICGDYGSFAKTTNGGTTWSIIDPLGTGATDVLEELTFPTPDTGYMVKAYYMLKTVNAGLNWTEWAIPFQTKSLHFFDTNNGAALGNIGSTVYFFTTANGGVTWDTTNLPLGNYYTKSFMLNNNYGFIVGQGGVILKTTDGGVNWTSLTTGISWNLNNAFFLDNNNGWVISTSGRTYYTTDGGQNWTYDLISVASDYDFNDIGFVNSNLGFIIGESYFNGDGCVVYTNNGGLTWNLDAGSFNKLYAMEIIGNTVYVGGELGSLKKNSSFVGVNEVEFESQVEIYPNPAKNKIFIPLKNDIEDAAFQVFDGAGRQVLSGSISVKNEAIDISVLSSGVYLVKMQADSKSYSGSFVKE